jgi:hypothetical protein
MADPARKQELIAELATARTHLVGSGQALRHDLDLPAKLKRGIQAKPAAWFGGAAVLGILLSAVRSRRRRVVIKNPGFRRSQAEQAGKAAFALTALKFGIELAKPALLAWVKKNAYSRKAAPAV